jgi:hypothetical protein
MEIKMTEIAATTCRGEDCERNCQVELGSKAWIFKALDFLRESAELN